MTDAELKDFDLNLLRSLSVLLRTRHISQAADELGLTQSGMSRNLARLRQQFDDPLLLRVGNRMVLTPKAEQLLGPLEDTLKRTRKLLHGNAFDPTSQAMHFTIAASDFLTQLYLPEYLGQAAQIAPQLSLTFIPWGQDTLSALELGEVDFVFGSVSEVPPGVYQKVMRHARYVCICRKGHPLFENGFSLESYAAARHVAVTLSGKGANPIDVWLAGKGVKRQIAVSTRFLVAGIVMVSHSDMVMLIDDDIARRASKLYDIDIMPVPLAIPMPPFALYWHERTRNSEAHAWLIEQLVGFFSALG